VRITVLAPDASFERRPESVGVPFGFGAPSPLPLRDLSALAPFEHQGGRLASVDPAHRLAVDDRHRRLPYDALVIAAGARPRAAIPGVITFAGPDPTGRLERILAACAARPRPRLAFTMPTRDTWALPLYELALMAGVDLRDRGSDDADLVVATPEPAPLWVFGAQAGEAFSALLRDRGIDLRTDVRPIRGGADGLELSDGSAIEADDVIALPALEGPAICGLPHDQRGFLPVDPHGRVIGVGAVYAAGDATTFPLKQGGLATQQADAVAEALAAAAGAPVEPEPFRPVLRGLLLTGGAPLYLRARLNRQGRPEGSGSSVQATSRQVEGEVSARALWWPPGKVAGRYLAPLLATARPVPLRAGPMVDRGWRPPSGGQDDDRGAALELALLLADQDAAVGDFTQAVHALDAAFTLAGGVLPPGYAAKRTEWERAHGANLARPVA
jgi:sulfide:quinone oxidoreductase